MIFKILGFLSLFVTLACSHEALSLSERLNSSLLWGPYRSNLYFGVRPRIPHSLLTGLMWFNVDDYSGVGNIRHACDQRDDMASFGWTKYDPRSGGRQVIQDRGCKIDLVTDFIKNDQGNWGVRIRGTPRDGYNEVKTSLVFYAGLEGEGLLTSPMAQGALIGDLDLVGFSESLDGGFTISITENNAKNSKVASPKLVLDPELDPSKSHYLSLHVPDDNVWKARDIFMTLLQESIQQLTVEHENIQEIPPEQLFVLRNTNNFDGNLHFVQKTFQGEFEFFVTLNKDYSDAQDEINQANFDAKFEQVIESFDAKFADRFQLQLPFNKAKFQNFAKDFLSNLLGGIGYFYGDSLVDRTTEIDELTFAKSPLVGEVEPLQELFTSVPSRPFFPRGFYWDEGFHLLVISEFDLPLALEILSSWFGLIDDDGWIAREQILGPEARSKVPEEFQVQSPNIANPPTMMLSFIRLLENAKVRSELVAGDEKIELNDKIELDDKIKFGSFNETHLNGSSYLEDPHVLLQYAEEVYPKLLKHYEWFRRTQKGELDEFDRRPRHAGEAYRWRGSTKTHCLASGLDDYPRAEIPDTAELHVDLITWIGVMTRSMKQMAELLDKQEDFQRFSEIERLITENIEDLHWSEKEHSYCDVTLDDDTEEDVLVCHKGYVSLFPFANKFIPADSEKLYHVVKLIRDPQELWSNYGIRSLSKSCAKFHTGEDYWRGNIWININYLVLDALRYYAEQPETNPKIRLLMQVTYKQLRENLVRNIYKEWKRTGYAYEQYQEVDGRGTRTRHFLGWTSLALLIMKMPEEV